MNHWDDEDDLYDSGIKDIPDYDAYLDLQLTDEDLFYLEDKELARNLIAAGCHGKGDIMSKEQFNEKKEAI